MHRFHWRDLWFNSSGFSYHFWRNGSGFGYCRFSGDALLVKLRLLLLRAGNRVANPGVLRRPAAIYGFVICVPLILLIFKKVR
jgi:hypothetical protein